MFLVCARIENDMQRFKDFERDLKTKAGETGLILACYKY